MRRIGLAVILMLSLTLVSLDAEGQRSGKIPRLGILSVGGGPPTVIEAFPQGYATWDDLIPNSAGPARRRPGLSTDTGARGTASRLVGCLFHDYPRKLTEECLEVRCPPFPCSAIDDNWDCLPTSFTASSV